MRNHTKLIGIIAFVAVIGFSMAVLGCDEEKDELDGTTLKASDTRSGVTIDYIIKFTSPNFTMTATADGQSKPAGSGTYSISGSAVTLTIKDEDGKEESEKGVLSDDKKILSITGMIFTKQ